MRADWFDHEPTFPAILRQTATWARRGLRRRWLATTLVTASVVALALGAASRPRPYEATAFLRISETDMSEKTGVVGKDDLRGWLAGAALTSTKLLEIAKRHELYPHVWARGDEAVVEMFRDDLEIQVSENYFVQSRGVGDELRSARLSIEYSAPDPDIAADVVIDLANTAIEFEHNWRVSDARGALEAVRGVADRIRADVEQREEELVSSLATTDVRNDPRARLMNERVLSGHRVLNQVLNYADALDLRLRAEAADLGQRVMLAHVERPVRRNLRMRLFLVGATVLAFGIPLAALATGAFDGTIRSAADVTDLTVTEVPMVRRKTREQQS